MVAVSLDKIDFNSLHLSHNSLLLEITYRTNLQSFPLDTYVPN